MMTYIRNLYRLLNVGRRKCKTLLAWPITDQLLIPIVFVILGLMRACILCLPYRKYASILGDYDKTAIYTPILNTAQTIRARRIGRIVRATAKITPWESLCFPQALTASLFMRLAGLPYIMHFGLAKNHNPGEIEPLKAHAWVTAGPVAVTGGRSLRQFTVVGTYIYSAT